MTGSVAIDVAIGLCFIYLLYGLLTTIVQEMLTRRLGLRSRMLLKAVARMLDDYHPPRHKGRIAAYFDDIQRDLHFYFVNSFRSRPFAEAFYNHPTIKYLGETTWSSKPSYLSDKIFSQTLIDILRGSTYDGSENQMDLIRTHLDMGVINPAKQSDLAPVQQEEIRLKADKKTLAILKRFHEESGDDFKKFMELVKHSLREKNINLETFQFAKDSETLRQLKLYCVEANGDIEKFKLLIEAWYNETMERCTGWFKRQAQFIAFIMGLTIAIFFNVDTLTIAKLLSKNTKAREQMVALASANAKSLDPARLNVENATDEQLNTTFSDLKKISEESEMTLGAGWNCKTRAEFCESWFLKILGWLITAFAISLGAPFWFDILNKVMMLRGGKRTDSEPVQEAINTSGEISKDKRTA